MRTVLITSVVALILVMTLPADSADAVAPMRPGQPEVLTPARQAPPTIATPWSELRQRLGARNRVMLFWEDGLDGSVATRYREVQTLDRQVHGKAAQAGTVAHHYDGSTGVAVAGARAHLHERRERYTEDDAPIAPALSHEARSLQSEFMAQLRQGGVRFIDRTLATRLAGMSVQGERPNAHAIEMHGLVDHADYLMEVNSRSAPDAASGRRFHVALRDVASGETLVDFETAAEPAQGGPRPWVATGSGFERAEDPVASDAEVARLLAIETGRQLAGRVSR